MITVFAPAQTNRVRYIFDFVFKQHFKLDYQILSDRNAFQNAKGPKLCYNTLPLGESLFIQSDELLFQLGIHPFDLPIGKSGDLITLFPVPHAKSLLTFDIFAASFYLICRYEEYLEFDSDEHGRFPASSSVAAKYEFLDIPIVNCWLNLLRDRLNSNFSGLIPEKPTFHFTPTFDIDYAWEYKHKGAFRNFGGFLRDLSKFDFPSVLERFRVLTGKEPDPFHTFPAIRQIHPPNQKVPVFFFLVGEYGAFDKNIPSGNSAFQKLIRSLQENYPIGLHPSYGSNFNKITLDKELYVLSSVTAKRITYSRQHFIRFRLPDTYRLLLQIGIKEEYSMGYPDKTGFRAGYAGQFYWFDLENDCQTELIVRPFALMDVTLNHYLGLGPSAAIEKCRYFINAVSKEGGELITVWHNNALSGKGIWKGWQEVYPSLVKYAQEKESR